ncbi:MAG: GTP cyclohydrolase II [Alphaproteobacteria bacterium]|nr:GTP cyclohydrolase II [Alphaproteobacteria bacterium]
MSNSNSPSLSVRQRETVDRAIAELRRGGAVVVTGGGDEPALLIQAAETVVGAAPFEGLPRTHPPKALIVTGRRAAILGLADHGPRSVLLNGIGAWSCDDLAPFIDPEVQGPVPPPGVTASTATAGSAADAAIRLVKIARLLPAAVAAPIGGDAAGWASSHNRVVIAASAIDGYDRMQAEDLRIVGEARVPLADTENCRIISFRPLDGGAEHLAIVIGALDIHKPVLTRLHSECFTGDLLGSLRCDCGDQLRAAIQTIAAQGSGVLLYLAQEGRGIGLVNKLRAYRLQDFGFDTVDANEQLGFDDDERIYLPAVHMLKQLGIGQVRLLTNNPAKVGALARHGIDVVERVPQVMPSNDHNRGYLATKATRSGHLL